MTAEEVARVVAGTLEGDDSVCLTGAEVDSRRLRSGDVFVALPGARRDGHDFVDEALRIAGAALVRRDVPLSEPPPGRALVRVDEPLTAYHELARRECHGRRWKVVAVTGSVGKTTTKDFLARFLATRWRTGASEGNRNSTLGLPAEILSQDEGIEVFVAEAGMSSVGELTTLGEILRPSVVLYTRIAPVHTEFFPNIEGIVRAKAELLPWLDNQGTLVVNADDPHQESFPDQTDARILRYGGALSEARIENLEDRGLLGSRFFLVLPDSEAMVELALAGVHQAENLLAAAAAASVFGVSAEDVANTAADLSPAAHRGRVLTLADGVSLVDDSYNASPLAVSRVLELLARAPGRRIAVLGEMYELGELAAEAHETVGVKAAASCDLLVAVGGAHARLVAASATRAGLPQRAVHLAGNAEEAAELLRGLLHAGDVVLVKGSRGVGLDRTVAALAGEEAA
jgi:UDP-N-acetylmuramoyl-tripeptide--D-alanyl-D-alanine ligase